ncbi:MAG: DUF1819 family protein [Candidatus Izemoplasmataceae bacterium]
MNKKPYSSAIKKTPYKYLISKKIAKLILKGMDRNEVYHECFDKNIIQIDSLQRRREVTNVVYDRLLTLDNVLLQEFVHGDIATSKFILVYAITKADRLFFDFMYEVYRESLLTNKEFISLDDFDNFFISKKEYDPIVNKWGHFTIDCLTKGYRNILVESGIGKRVKRNISSIKIMIHPDVRDHIENIGDYDYLKAILGEK